MNQSQLTNSSVGTLKLLCGKMGSGKSTLANELAIESSAIKFSEDQWLADLYPGEISKIEDYIRLSARLKPKIREVSQLMLSTGYSVILDFPANTPKQRQWLRSIADEVNAPHELYWLPTTDEECLTRIAKRAIDQPERSMTDNLAMFKATAAYFIKPEKNEGLNVITVPGTQATAQF